MPKSKETIAEEGTEAMATLAPNSRTGMMANVMQAMNNMPAQDMIAFFQQVMDQFGPGKTGAAIPDGAAAQNMGSIAAKGQAVANEELLGALGTTELTEDAKTQITAIFEAAVTLKAQEEIARLEEEANIKLEESVRLVEEELTNKIDNYLTYAVESWAKENELAIENGVKLEVYESFINDVIGLAKKHNINLTDAEANAVAVAESKIEQVEEQLEETTKNLIAVTKELQETKKRVMVSEATSGMAMSQADKLRTLAESLSYENLEDFGKKLSAIKTSLFKESTAPKDRKEEVMGVAPLVEETEVEQSNNSEAVDPVIANLAKRMSSIQPKY